MRVRRPSPARLKSVTTSRAARSRSHSVVNQHGDGQRTNAAGHRRDRRGNARDIVESTSPTRTRPFDAVVHDPRIAAGFRGLVRVMQPVDPDATRCPRPHEFGGDESGSADSPRPGSRPPGRRDGRSRVREWQSVPSRPAPSGARRGAVPRGSLRPEPRRAGRRFRPSRDRAEPGSRRSTRHEAGTSLVEETHVLGVQAVDVLRRSSESMTRARSCPASSGIWTRTPSTSGSRFARSTACRSSSGAVPEGSRRVCARTPASSAARVLAATYVSDAGSWPRRRTASEGGGESSRAAAWASRRICFARAVPSSAITAETVSGSPRGVAGTAGPELRPLERAFDTPACLRILTRPLEGAISVPDAPPSASRVHD
jgi:hypothetical protein